MTDMSTRFQTSMRVPSSPGTVELVPGVAGRSLHVVSIVLTASGTPPPALDLTVAVTEAGAATPLVEPRVTASGGLRSSAYFGERGYRQSTGQGLLLTVSSISGSASAVVTVTGFVGE